jgi:outer membrane protein assembly factor BamA
MKIVATLTLLVALGAWGAVRSLPAGDEVIVVAPPKQEVHSIAIDGGPGLPQTALREVMATHVGAALDTIQLERDRVALLSWLTSRGYLAAKVAPPVVTFGPTGGAYIVFDIEPGTLFHLGDVKLVGNDWNRAGVVTLATGDEARADRLERARLAAEDTLSRTGKSLHVELVAEPDAAAAVVDVSLITR